MCEKIPTLKDIVKEVEGLGLERRKKGKQGRKRVYADTLIISLAIYQKLAGFHYAQQMLYVLYSFGVDVPSPSRFSERKSMLIKACGQKGVE